MLVLSELDEGIIDIEKSHQVSLRHLELPLGDPELVALPPAGRQEDVLNLQHGYDGDDLLAAAELARTDQHLGEAGMYRQLRHLFSQRFGQTARLVNGPESEEKLQGGDEVAGRRRRGEVEPDDVVDTESFQLEKREAEVSPL